MNKTIALIVSAGTFICIIALVVLLILSDKDPSAVFNALPGIAASLAALFAIGTVSGKVDKVQGQTNGTLSALRAENAALQAHNSALLTVVTPYQAGQAKHVETAAIAVPE